MFNRKLVPALAGLAALVAGSSAFATDPVVPDATAVLAGISATSAGYSTVMYGIAIASVTLLIGVKWIKRARGAA